MKNTYAEKVISKIYSLKNEIVKEDLKKFSFYLPSGIGIHLHCITRSMVDNYHIISILARFRSRANKWFPAQFMVTIDGTRKWLCDQLLNKDDRILFFLTREGYQKPFGHLGLNRFDFVNKSCEIDNVIRGRKEPGTKGAMTTAIRYLVKWAFEFLEVKNVYLSVFSDNHAAIKVYSQAGFEEINRRRVYKQIRNGIIYWEEKVPQDDSIDIERYFITMKFNKALL